MSPPSKTKPKSGADFDYFFKELPDGRVSVTKMEPGSDEPLVVYHVRGMSCDCPASRGPRARLGSGWVDKHVQWVKRWKHLDQLLKGQLPIYYNSKDNCFRVVFGDAVVPELGVGV